MTRVQTKSTLPVSTSRRFLDPAALLERSSSKAKLERVKDEMVTKVLRSELPVSSERAKDTSVCAEMGVRAAAVAGAVKRGLQSVEALEQGAEPANEESRSHVVVPGDTLSAIAAANDVTLPELLAVNPQIANPDLIEPGQVIALPGSASEAPAASPAAPAEQRAPGDLPTSAAEADGLHRTQFFDEKYNPTGPMSSANCGPASLATTLEAVGKMPPGLTPEQSVDYARSLMNPDTLPSSYVTSSDGQSIPQLDTDGDTSNVGQLQTAASSLGVPTENSSGWDALDATLESGRPVVANGDAYQGWRDQFPHENGKRYGNGDIGHFNTILGKTADGKYVVSDPMYTGGPVEMTREQLSAFFGPTYGGVPHFLAVG